jgi:uncharacterized protein (DUF58 family)
MKQPMKQPLSHFDPKVLSNLKHLLLRARFVVDGLMVGIHPSRAKGFSSEFEGHREYAQGDDVRYIDWKTYGKFDRYFVKEYRETTNVRAHIVLDASGSMGYASNGWSKFDYGSTLAASLAYLMLKQQDAVGLITFSGKTDTMLPAKATQNHLFAILQALEERQPSGETKTGLVLQELAGSLKRKGLVIVISDLLGDTENTAAVLRGLKQLRSRKHDVMVFHLLDKDELEFPFQDTTIFKDMEEDIRLLANPHEIRSAYLKALDNLVTEYKETCAANLIDYSLFNTTVGLDRALTRYLTWRSRFRPEV